MKGQETRGFQSEVKQLLHLMIHSLYSNKEIFLRELISNASDAADKLRFRALSQPDLYEGDGELRVRVSFDKDNRTLTIADNGIGMSRDLAGLNQQRPQVKAKGPLQRARAVARRVALAVGAVTPQDQAGPDQRRQMPAQRAFGHAMRAL